MLENRCDLCASKPRSCRYSKNSLPNFDEIMDLSDFFKVMSDSTRLQLLISLQHSEMCVSDLANCFKTNDKIRPLSSSIKGIAYIKAR